MIPRKPRLQILAETSNAVRSGTLAKLASDITDATLLCERCGYVLEGLDERGACPECGRPIAESLPSARTGTPFQNLPSWSGFAAHCRMLAGRPAELFGKMRVADDRDPGIAGDAFNLAAFVTLAPVIWRAWLELLDGPSPAAIVLSLGCLAIVWYCMRQTMVLLTWIERAGVVFFSRRRGWRIGKELAAAICANAAPGWIAAGLLMNVGFALCHVVDLLKPYLPLGQWALRDAIKAGLPVLGFIAGMLIFETLVYIGVRRCKFANWIARPAPDRPGSPAAQPADPAHTPAPPPAP